MIENKTEKQKFASPVYWLYALRDSVFVFALIQLLGAVSDIFIREGRYLASTINIIYWVLFVLLAFGLYVKTKGKFQYKRKIWIVLSLVFMHAILVLYIADTNINLDRTYSEKYDLWLPLTNDTKMHKRADRQYLVTTNELGLRIPKNLQVTDYSIKIAFIGDSFFFGSGVNNEFTIDRQMAKNFPSLNNKPISYINAAQPGYSLFSYVRVAKFIQDSYKSDLFIIHLKNDDLYKNDINDRLSNFVNSWFYKWMTITGLEISHEILKQIFREAKVRPFSENAIVDELNLLIESFPDSQFLFVTNLPENAKEAFKNWISDKPKIGWVCGSKKLDWSSIDSIPNDGHWTEKGIETVGLQLKDPIISVLNESVQAFQCR